MRRLSLGVALICLMVFLGPVLSVPVLIGQAGAAEPAKPPENETPSEMLKDATRTILRALGLMLQAIPQYETPEILDNGDIIIRRKPPQPTPPPEKDSDPDAPDKTKI